ncbi:MAG TPA: FecR domain-containing protein [Bacteroidota bacterium]|nr:FecR domain-containing protein [Bacteroidota bacterium]
MEERIDWERLARYFAGESSPYEITEIEKWMEADPLRREFVDSLRSVWEATGKRVSDWDDEKAWNTVRQRLNIHPPLREARPMGKFRTQATRGMQFLRMAAAIVLLLGAPYVVWKYTSLTSPDVKPTMREVVTERGERARIRLADGSTVLLNSASAVRFPDRFDQGVRELHLEGEAYFNVKTISESPFVVRTNKAEVKALGTEFNVSAWPDEHYVNVVVAQGSVAFFSRQTETPTHVILQKGQMSNLKEDGTLSSPQAVDLDKKLDWVNGRMLFDNTTFEEVLKRLERRYDFSFSVSNPSLLRKRLTASFKDESLDEVLKIASLSLGVRYERIEKRVVFH